MLAALLNDGRDLKKPPFLTYEELAQTIPKWPCEEIELPIWIAHSQFDNFQSFAALHNLDEQDFTEPQDKAMVVLCVTNVAQLSIFRALNPEHYCFQEPGCLLFE